MKQKEGPPRQGKGTTTAGLWLRFLGLRCHGGPCALAGGLWLDLLTPRRCPESTQLPTQRLVQPGFQLCTSVSRRGMPC